MKKTTAKLSSTDRIITNEIAYNEKLFMMYTEASGEGYYGYESNDEGSRRL